MQHLVRLYTIIIVTKRINMTFSKTIKDITFIPFVIKDTWTTIRDLSINQFRANQHVAKSIKEILDSVEKFTKNQNDFNTMLMKKMTYVEVTNTSLGKWHEWQEKFNESLLEKIISEKKLTALLRDNFDSIDINISEHEIDCNSQEAINSVECEIEELNTRIQDLSSNINEMRVIIEELKNQLTPQNKSEEIIDVV